MLCTIEDIKVGDEVIFLSTNSQSNFDEYWVVIGITGNDIHIKLTKLGYNAFWTIHISEVVGHISL